jgi:hypothetical protein
MTPSVFTQASACKHSQIDLHAAILTGTGLAPPCPVVQPGGRPQNTMAQVRTPPQLPLCSANNSAASVQLASRSLHRCVSQHVSPQCGPPCPCACPTCARAIPSDALHLGEGGRNMRTSRAYTPLTHCPTRWQRAACVPAYVAHGLRAIFTSSRCHRARNPNVQGCTASCETRNVRKNICWAQTRTRGHQPNWLELRS